MSTEPDEVHEHFKKTALASMPAVRAFERYLAGRGYETRVKEVTVSERREDGAAHSDAEDILARKNGGAWKRFEVKGRTFVFTCCEDFPHPTIYVERTSKTCDPADWYITLSKDLCYAAVVDGKTYVDWDIEHSFDRTKGIPISVFVYPKGLARFIKIGG